jgi:hypothetical protein
MPPDVHHGEWLQQFSDELSERHGLDFPGSGNDEKEATFMWMTKNDWIRKSGYPPQLSYDLSMAGDPQSVQRRLRLIEQDIQDELNKMLSQMDRNQMKTALQQTHVFIEGFIAPNESDVVANFNGLEFVSAGSNIGHLLDEGEEGDGPMSSWRRNQMT